jgi:DNA-binding response OmpR family regulator
MGDGETRRLLAHAVEARGAHVAWTRDEASVLAAVRDGDVDLVIVALAAPEIDAFRLVQSVRAHGDVPVVMLSRRNTETHRVLAFEVGADDFIAVPCSSRELAVRVDAVLRRSRPQRGRVVEHRGLTIDLDSREVVADGDRVDLTRREFDLLALLAGRPRRTFSREELLREVWGSSVEWQSAATVTEHVRRLRRKLARVCGDRVIVTVHGVGYRFE